MKAALALLAIVCCSFMSSANAENEAEPVRGLWQTGEQRWIIEIYDCKKDVRELNKQPVTSFEELCGLVPKERQSCGRVFDVLKEGEIVLSGQGKTRDYAMHQPSRSIRWSSLRFAPAALAVQCVEL